MRIGRRAHVFGLTPLAGAVSRLLGQERRVVELDVGTAGETGRAAGATVDLGRPHAVHKPGGSGIPVDDCAPSGRGRGVGRLVVCFRRHDDGRTPGNGPRTVGLDWVLFESGGRARRGAGRPGG